jgi:cytochrome c-type biogenesis protein CcmH
MPKRRSVALAVIVLLSILAWPVHAQTPTPNQIDAIARDLWCPLCNGVRLDNCDLQACIQMREVISQKLAVGESKAQIKAYFVQQYGDVVLGAPANEGFNRLVWLLPILLAIVALGWLAYLVRMWRLRSTTVQSGERGPAQETGDEDEYAQRVDDELKRFQ